MSGDRLYFRQLRAGRDFARVNPIAAQMVNFVYLIGDRQSGECLIVDPAWDVDGLLEIAERDGMTVVGALATHYHPDHVGGDLFGFDVQGVARLLERVGVKVHVHREEADGLKKITGLSESDLARHDSGDILEIGQQRIEFIHTPGHTPGSQCFLVNGERLVSGDTLFVRGCGRVDLPGGDPEKMYESLTQKLAKLPDETILYPGHDYADKPTSTIGEEKQNNYYLRIKSLDEWLRLMR
ncbi:MAG: MBL fold metallo-hydrolase [Acidobacteria bacterium]|nr:MAG: MBL fold metallo-hydrolase [Acidobacteriota bacterium]